MSITVTLTPDQERFLEAEVASGHFPSIEAAVKIALENLLPGDDADLAWARPLVEEARAEALRGEIVSGQELEEILEQRINELRSRK